MPVRAINENLIHEDKQRNQGRNISYRRNHYAYTRVQFPEREKHFQHPEKIIRRFCRPRQPGEIK